jgi:uncharacterized protein YkuJ
MKEPVREEHQWVGIDVHVHTPASKDYRGPRETREYIDIIRRANEFSGSGGHQAAKRRFEEAENPVACVVFTDHNSVEGFQTYQNLAKDTTQLRDSIRVRDPVNPLLKELDGDLSIINSVRVLMGVEIKAFPGIHLLGIFHESVEPVQVVKFLEDLYGPSYGAIAGDPKPVTKCTLLEALDRTIQTFADKAVVIAPHIDTGDGLYEGLKEHGQARIGALRHAALKALSFNKLETRERVRKLLDSPDYRRPDEVALIQSSDFHGQPGATIGQPRTYISVPKGKVSFHHMREAFTHPKRVRCSLDRTNEEYERLIKGEFVVRYMSEPDKCAFRECDFQDIAATLCAMCNSNQGILELEGYVLPEAERETYVNAVIDQLKGILEGRLEPSDLHFMHRDLRFSPGRVSILIKPFPSERLHLSDGSAFVVRGEQKCAGSAQEIEVIVSRKIEQRFGHRLTDTLEGVSTESTLLSKMPAGIPLLIGCQDKLHSRLPAGFKLDFVEPVSSKGREFVEVVRDTYQRTRKKYPFGVPEGNATILWDQTPPRFLEHYLRFTTFRAQMAADYLQKCAWEQIDQPAIVVFPGGGVGLLEPGFIVADTPAMILQPGEGWADKVHALTA